MDEIHLENFSRNLSFLASHFPHLKAKLDSIRSAPGGAAAQGSPCALLTHPKPNILFRGRPYHAPRDPEREALSLVEGLAVRAGHVFIFMGVGIGYHIEAFRRLYGETVPTTLIAVEKSIEAFSLLLSCRDISFLEGVHLFVGEEAERIEAFFESLNPLLFKGYRIIRLRGACAPFPGYFKRLESSFRRAMSGKLSDVLTRFAFESLWMKNIVENVPSMVGNRSIRALKDAFRGKPAIVLGAGPSLLSQLDRIRDVASSAHVIAVDTVLDAVLAKGILPDFVVTLDAQFHNLLDFTGTFSGSGVSKGMTLVADLVCYPKIPKLWKGNLFFSSSALDSPPGGAARYELHPLVERLREFSGVIEALPCGGSVSTTAIELAIFMGAHPILTAGLDLAYTRALTHVNSSAPYNARLSSSYRLDPLLTQVTRSIGARPLRTAAGADGRPVLTDFVFLSYQGWISARQEYRGRVFTVSDEGLAIPGLDRLNMDEAIKGLSAVEKPAFIPSRSAPEFSRDSALLFLRSMKADTGGALREVDKLGADRLGRRESSRELYGEISHRYPFLRPILAEADVLYRERYTVLAHLAAFLSFLERRVERAQARTERGKTPGYGREPE